MTIPFALIIEDDEKLAEIFSIALQSLEFKVEKIQDGRVALVRLGETMPDVILLDLHLPYVSGRDLLHRIRSDERLAGTRVIVVTADAFMADTLGEEADLILLKPISPSQLRGLVSRLYPRNLPLN